MESHKNTQEQTLTQEEIMNAFYQKIFDSHEEGIKKISLEQLNELKEKGVTLENFLDYICQKYGLLLHGSIQEINGGKLRSRQGQIFASNKSAIAIMRSVYSNAGVNLEYPYFFDDDSFVLKIHTAPDNAFVSKENGFIYVLSSDGFENTPKGSWQFVKKAGEAEFQLVIETEKTDFQYPVEMLNDLDER